MIVNYAKRNGHLFVCLIEVNISFVKATWIYVFFCNLYSGLLVFAQRAISIVRIQLIFFNWVLGKIDLLRKRGERLWRMFNNWIHNCLMKFCIIINMNHSLTDTNPAIVLPSHISSLQTTSSSWIICKSQIRSRTVAQLNFTNFCNALALAWVC